MKRLRVTGDPELEAAPRVLRLIADSPLVSEARLREWNLSAEQVTALFGVDGDADRFRAALGDAPAIADAEVRQATGGRFYLLLSLRPRKAPIMREAFETLTRDGLLVLKPVVYRDGRVHAELVGEGDVLQAAVERLPPAGDLTVHEVGEYDGGPAGASGRLSDRQREAVRAALELGYYDVPRGATHEDVADRLGCASSTASEHLQWAEAKLVRAAMGRAAPPE